MKFKNIFDYFDKTIWRGKPSPRAYCVGRYPFQRGHPATPRSQDARSFQDSPPAATAALPDSFLTLAAASSQLVTCRAPSLHCRSNAGGGMRCLPPSFHLAGLLGESAPSGRSCFCQPCLCSLRCARPGSWDVPQRAKVQGCPRVCRMRAAPVSPCSLPCSADRASPPLILCFMHCGSLNPSFCFGF